MHRHNPRPSAPILLYCRRSLVAVLLASASVTLAATIKVPADQPTIQAGINVAAPGDTVLVSPGIYYENIDFGGKAITVTSSSGAAQTIIDGGFHNPAVTFESNETRASILSGFTIQHGGIANLFSGDAGIYVTDSAPSILNNVLTHNLCRSIHITVASPLIQNNNINNTDDPSGQCYFAGGSAIWVEGAQQRTSSALPPLPEIIGNVIEDNTQSGKEDAGGSGGAGIAVWGGNPVIQNNTIRNNKTLGTGGGINIVTGGAVVVQNLIYGNDAGSAGGLAFDFGTSGGPGPVIGFVVNNTIANNTVSGQYGYSGHPHSSQVYIWLQSSQTAFVNNIIYGSSTAPLVMCDPTWETYAQKITIFDHNDAYNSQGPLYGGTCTDQTGTFGNISANPLFLNPSASDFHLTAASPAIDAGNNSAWYLPQKDFDGNPRQQDFSGKNYPVIDLGAYESAGLLDANATLLTLVPSSYVIDAGTAFTLSSQLVSASGTPTGAVTFFEDGNQIGTAVIDASGKAILPFTGLIPGVHSFLATYPGQGAFPPAVSVVTFVVVNKYLSTLILTSSVNPSLLNQSVTFTATISSPDGTVLGPIVLTDGNTTLATLNPDSNGIATYTTGTLTIGSHFLKAYYAGDATHTSATDIINQQVVNGYPTPTTLTSSLNPAAIGQPVTFTTTTTFGSNGDTTLAAGTMTYSDGNTVLSVQPINAQSNTTATTTFTTSALTVGTHSITAILSAPNGFASAATLNQVIKGQPTTTALTATPNPANAYQTVALTASVTSIAGGLSGAITFYDGTTSLGSVPTGGANPANNFTASATLFASHLIAGTHILTAVYSGDAANGSSTSNAVTETVLLNPTATTLTATPNPSAATQLVTVTAQVSSLTSVPLLIQPCACTVTLTVAGLPPNVGSTVTLPVHDGAATFTFALGAGSYTFSAAFNGSPAFAASASTSIHQTVVPAATTLTLSASPNPAVQHQAVTLTATLAAPLSTVVPSGTLTFFDGATPFATAPFSVNTHSNTTTTTLAISTLAPGTHLITASYPGDSNFLPATSAPLSVTISPQDYTLSIANPSVTIQTQHHLGTTVALASIGGFADTIRLACTNLPIYATCTFRKDSISLSADANASTTLILDTDEVPGYASNQRPRFHPVAPITLALLFPAFLLFGFTKRRTLPIRLALLLVTAVTTLTLSSCSGRYPGNTPPGTYTINITSRGTATGVAHTAAITLTVTP